MSQADGHGANPKVCGLARYLGSRMNNPWLWSESVNEEEGRLKQNH